MTSLHLPERDLNGENEVFQQTVEDINQRYKFDFTAIGLTAHKGAPLKWVYGAGATNDRYKRIVLAPGHGIGGIVIKSGKPMMFLDIDEQIDPREYSSYPIVFAEDLRSFCCLPLFDKDRVIGAILCAFRTNKLEHEQQYRQMIRDIKGNLVGFDVGAKDFLYRSIAFRESEKRESEGFTSISSLSQTIAAQENERRRISRELHDGIAQELLSVCLLIQQLQDISKDPETDALFAEINSKIDGIMDELHNLSVELRPSTLDNLGLVAALKSRAHIFERTYGARVRFSDKLKRERFNRSLETQVYRICQEAILNACKYAESESIFVELEEKNGALYATITDKGRGFNVEQPEIRGSGCGLTGIQERASLIGAMLKIESGADGTRVTLIAPFELKEKE